ncbi:MAG: hypothetical protein CMK32_06295 [Porticoccaceae bacterium]|nr:hypothetical protein [Porticoccaceae bacterium]
MMLPALKSVSFGFFLLCVALAPDAWAQEPAAEKLIARFKEANRYLNYQGIYTYEYGGVLKAVRVTHIEHKGEEYAHWLYLNGPRQEVVRRGQWRCGSPLNNDAAPGARFSDLPIDRLQALYDIRLRGADRAADRPMWLIHLVPRDESRYGYVLGIDQETGFLLQVLLLDESQRVLERFQYLMIDYQVPEARADELVALAPASENCADPAESASPSSRWQATWLPPGFERVSVRHGDDGLETLIYSDGLAVFSIFIDSATDAGLPEVQAQRGATVAQLAQVQADGNRYLVSVVGEIPIQTAQRVAGFVRRTGAPQ